MCSRWYSHALARVMTPSSALRPRHGAPAAWALCPLNLKSAEIRASAGSSPHEMPYSSPTCAKRFASTSRNAPAREPVPLEDRTQVLGRLDLLHSELAEREDLVDHLLSEGRFGVDGPRDFRLESVEPLVRGRLRRDQAAEQEERNEQGCHNARHHGWFRGAGHVAARNDAPARDPTPGLSARP